MSSRKRQIKHADIVKVFAERLRTLRVAKSLTQSELANRSKITISYISTLEAGSVAPGIDLIEKLALALEVSVVDLLPTSPPAEVEAIREDVRNVSEAVIKVAGRDTLSMLKVLLNRIGESASLKS